MGEIRGHVTRARGAFAFELMGVTDNNNNTGLGRARYTATKADGTHIGDFPGCREAQRAVENSTGAKLLKWQRRDLPNAIEHYEGRGTEFSPEDLGLLLINGGWWRSDQGVITRPTGPAPAPLLVRQWFSRNGRVPPNLIVASQPTLADQPELIAEADAYLPALRFDAAATDFMTTNLTIAAPATVFAVASYAAAAHGLAQRLVESATFFFEATAAGLWNVNSAGAAVLGPAAAPGAATIVSAIFSTLPAPATEAFINGVSIGTTATAPGSALVTISDAVMSWAEDIQEILIVPAALGTPGGPTTRHDEVINYLKRRYGIS